MPVTHVCLQCHAEAKTSSYAEWSAVALCPVASSHCRGDKRMEPNTSKSELCFPGQPCLPPSASYNLWVLWNWAPRPLDFSSVRFPRPTWEACKITDPIPGDSDPKGLDSNMQQDLGKNIDLPHSHRPRISGHYSNSDQDRPWKANNPSRVIQCELVI